MSLKKWLELIAAGCSLVGVLIPLVVGAIKPAQPPTVIQGENIVSAPGGVINQTVQNVYNTWKTGAGEIRDGLSGNRDSSEVNSTSAPDQPSVRRNGQAPDPRRAPESYAGSAKPGAEADEVEEVDEVLADKDKKQGIAELEQLLKSENPTRVRRGRIAGLTSSDAEMQVVALNAIFDTGGPFKLIMDLSVAPEEKHGLKRGLARGGSWSTDGKQGVYVFSTSPYDRKSRCWKFAGHPNCAFSLAGRTVSLDGWSGANGSVELNSEGRLVGNFRSTRRTDNVSVPAYIPLID